MEQETSSQSLKERYRNAPNKEQYSQEKEQDTPLQK